ncbi:MAG TPA: YihY/virulence factor BrkB family protein [Ilumatobacter sp.]
MSRSLQVAPVGAEVVAAPSGAYPGTITTSDPIHRATPPLAPRALARWVWRLTRDVWDEYRTDNAGDLAASITFWTILSIPAAALALVSALSSLEALAGTSVSNDVEERVQSFVADTFVDSDTIATAITELFDGTNAGVVTMAALLAVFTLSRAFAGLIRAMDIAYEVDEGRTWWQVRLVAIGLGIGTIAVAAASATFLAILPSLPLSWALRWLTAPLVVAGIVVWCATLFHVGPNHRTPWRYDLPGAVVTTAGWVAASQLFAVYVRFAGNANQVQSGVGAILLGLSLVYLLSLVLVVGAEVNDVIARRAGIVQQPRSLRTRARVWRAGRRPGAR